MAVLEQVNTQSRQLRVGRAVLLAVAAVLWLFGWLAGMTVRAVSWVGAAILIGWTDSRVGSRRR